MLEYIVIILLVELIGEAHLVVDIPWNNCRFLFYGGAMYSLALDLCFLLQSMLLQLQTTYC